MTTESEFERLAGAVLQDLMDRIEDLLPDADAELQSGILTVDLPGKGQYLLNKHVPNREIWLASPRSGAWHFAADGRLWRSTRTVDGARPDLHGLLAAELGIDLPPAQKA